MESAAAELLAPQFAEIVTKTTQPLFQPIFDLTVPQMAFGRIALLGDAAFVARPHCGMGVTESGRRRSSHWSARLAEIRLSRRRSRRTAPSASRWAARSSSTRAIWVPTCRRNSRVNRIVRWPNAIARLRRSCARPPCHGASDLRH